MEVTNANVLARVLDGMHIEYQILSDTQADVFAKINVSKLAEMLQKEKCEIISMQEHDESLESYYISLVGGEKNA
jgi:ABC-2 type transport system ATP-binding protein